MAASSNIRRALPAPPTQDSMLLCDERKVSSMSSVSEHKQQDERHALHSQIHFMVNVEHPQGRLAVLW